MNPPFSADEHHILHAYNISPAGCTIISLCNYETVTRGYSNSRIELQQKVSQYGSYIDLGECFGEAERRTNVRVALVTLHKPAYNTEQEFDGFFMEDEPEEQGTGIMPHNVVRELVNRYKGAVILFDKQLELGEQMATLISPFAGKYSKGKLGFQCTHDGKPLLRNEFKKDLQKAAWNWVFEKMNMNRLATKGLREDINKFVERQQSIPFTMRNVFRMVEIVIGTTDQRMDKAIIEVFDKLTQHYHENRYNVEGWKTNSHYLINQKFILPYSCEPSFSRGINFPTYTGTGELVIDLIKALCYITGEPYNHVVNDKVIVKHGMCEPINGMNDLKPNTWYDWGFFEFKVFKKGTTHFKFKDIEVWAKLNQNIARIKGYPLFEHI
jgi:hypothetical protein